jgi:hypothetical protein
VFITNVVKCRPPENRDPEPDEVAACAPYLKRQLEVLDPALVVTLGRHSMARFMPGVRISQAHGTVRAAEAATGATDAMVLAMYHPAAALRSTEVERQSYEDIGLVPNALEDARRRRSDRRVAAPVSPPMPVNAPAVTVGSEPASEQSIPPGGAARKAALEPAAVPIAVAVAVASGESPPGNPPRDIEPARLGDQASRPADGMPGQRTAENAETDPSDQLPLF